VKFDRLSPETQAGLRLWAIWQHNDEMLFDGIGSDPEHWAWLCWQLRVAEDRPEWFPKGKFATILVIENWLYDEAIDEVRLREGQIRPRRFHEARP
jgi:hypothetical protein